MPQPSIIRPRGFKGSERWDELQKYLVQHHERATTSREQQLSYQKDWALNYEAIPREQRRAVPWYNSSNFVVPVIRMFVDTFCARTLNIVFTARPLFRLHGFPPEQKDALEEYLNWKAMHEWDLYRVTRDFLNRGNKFGTATVKQPWKERFKTEVYEDEGAVAGFSSNEVTVYDGPYPHCVSFEDWYGYPSTANTLDELVIQFHRVRYPEEIARRLNADEKKGWGLTDSELSTALKTPDDVKRQEDQQDAGIEDYDYNEFQTVECFLEYALDGKDHHRIVGVLQPDIGRLLDVYFDPTPPLAELFTDYRPYPKEDLIWGQSMGRLLEQAQEEASSIHNERRNNSYLASAPIFKIKSGARVPNPSQNWFPGKGYVVDEMDDMAIEMIGRNYADMIPEENQTLTVAQMLVGHDPGMAAMAQGGPQKGGKVYNSSGTLAVMGESNRRQMTNIRDARDVLARVGRNCLIWQVKYGPGYDPALGAFPQEKAELIRAALEAARDDDVMGRTQFEVRTSDAATNKEARISNLVMMGNLLNQYGQQIVGIAQNLVAIKNPLMQRVLIQTARMQRDMAHELLRESSQHDLEAQVVDLDRVLQELQEAEARRGQGGPQAGMAQPGGNGRTGGPGGLGETVAQLAQVPVP